MLRLLLLSLVPLFVSSLQKNLQFNTDEQCLDLQEFVNHLVETKMTKILQENNIKMSNEMYLQNQRISNLEEQEYYK